MTVLRPRIDWRSLDRAALGEAYNSAAAVANSGAITASWEPRSAAVRQRTDAILDLAYGPRPRNRIDFIKCDPPRAPTLVFVHGGYWQMRAKESFAFAATGPLAAGINVALVGYTLAPAASMDEIVAEIRSALDWLAAKLPALGGDPEKLLLSGWSAGAQLAAMTMDHPSVRGCLAISGIYDLEPMRHCYVNDKLGLDEATALRNSPIRLQPSSESSARRRGWRRRASADAATIRRLRGGALPARTTCAAPRNSGRRPFFHSRRDGAERRLDCRYPTRVCRANAGL